MHWITGSGLMRCPLDVTLTINLWHTDIFLAAIERQSLCNSKADTSEWLDFVMFVLYAIYIYLSTSQSWTFKNVDDFTSRKLFRWCFLCLVVMPDLALRMYNSNTLNCSRKLFFLLKSLNSSPCFHFLGGFFFNELS